MTDENDIKSKAETLNMLFDSNADVSATEQLADLINNSSPEMLTKIFGQDPSATITEALDQRHTASTAKPTAPGQN